MKKTREYWFKRFLNKANSIHKKKYDYSKVNYIDSSTKIEIVCPQHGSFWQTPAAHLSGKGCPRCKFAKQGPERRISNKEFIKRARSVHGRKYDYSKAVYLGRNRKLEIICPRHGSFWMKPSNHINSKQGCPECGRERISELKSYSNADIIERFQMVHQDHYDYSRVKYTGIFNKVEIVCPKHGSFWQKPNDHINGHGCPKCHTSIGENRINNYLSAYLDEEYYWHYKFDDCVSKRGNKLEFDFYIPGRNLLIEFQGQYHYKIVNKYDTQARLDLQIENDNIKRKYCKDNNVTLLEIPIARKDKLEEILEYYLFN